MQIKRIAEYSMGSILQYVRPPLSYQLSLRSLFCLSLSGCLHRFYCISKRQSDFAISRGFYFHEIAKIKPSRIFPNLRCRTPSMRSENINMKDTSHPVFSSSQIDVIVVWYMKVKPYLKFPDCSVCSGVGSLESLLTTGLTQKTAPPSPMCGVTFVLLVLCCRVMVSEVLQEKEVKSRLLCSCEFGIASYSSHVSDYKNLS